MDPVSILTAAASLTAETGKIIWGLVQFADAVNDGPGIITTFYNNINHLHQVLKQFDGLLGSDNGHAAQQFEEKHFTSISTIMASCKVALGSLAGILPRIREKHSLPDKIRDALVLKLSEDTIRHQWMQVDLYAQMLQMSTSALTLTSLWKTQESQGQIKAAIMELINEIRLSKLMDASDGSVGSKLATEICQWRKSVERVAGHVTLRQPNSVLGTLPRIATLAPPPEADGESKMPKFCRPEPLGQQVLEYCLESNENIVAQMEECHLYLAAARYQEKGIGFRETLDAVYGVSFGSNHRNDMKEKLANLLSQCEMREEKTRAEEIYLELVRAEEMEQEQSIQTRASTQQLYQGQNMAPQTSTQQGQQSQNTSTRTNTPESHLKTPTERLCRQYHSMGSIKVALGKLAEGKELLEHAFGGRLLLEPMRAESVEESAKMLIDVCIQMGDMSEAEGVARWIKDKLHQGPPVAPQFAQGCKWCKQNGFNVDAPGFNFDQYNETKATTPIHLAVQRGYEEELKQMLKCLHAPSTLNAVCVEKRLAWPLIIAASARNSEMVAALVDAGVNLYTTDENGKTALHRCLSKEGGCRVAGLLLKKAPELVDKTDVVGKTALFMAVEMGNKEMVALLLAKRANPNICHEVLGTTVCSPLIAAICLVRHQRNKIGIVEMLLKHGADPGVVDRDGLDAVGWANKDVLAKGKIKAMIGASSFGRSSLSSGGDERRTRSSESSRGVNSKSLRGVDSRGESSRGVPFGRRTLTDISGLTGSTMAVKEGAVDSAMAAQAKYKWTKVLSLPKVFGRGAPALY